MSRNVTYLMSTGNSMSTGTSKPLDIDFPLDINCGSPPKHGITDIIGITYIIGTTVLHWLFKMIFILAWFVLHTEYPTQHIMCQIFCQIHPSDVSIICQTLHRSDVSVRCIDHMSDASSVTYIRRMYYIRQTNRSSLFLRSIINPKINPFSACKHFAGWAWSREDIRLGLSVWL
jgi:hypothetical protein